MNILITYGRSFVSLDFLRILKDFDLYIQESQSEFICK